jgi:RHS repeat-associated protein
MRKLYCLVALASCLILQQGQAQITPSSVITTPAPIQAVGTTPPAYNISIPLNYVRTWDVHKPIAVPNTVITDASNNDVTQSTQYVDGLGRPLQAVTRGMSPAGKDIVTPSVYDAFGREQYKYLLYVSPGMDGSFKTNPFNEQKTFMQAQYLGEQVFYSQTVFEPSLLNRITQTMAAGNSWAGSARGVIQSYEFNSGASEVVNWNILPAQGLLPVSAGYYPANQLYRNITNDEHNNRAIEYKDKEGKTILKKLEITVGADKTLHSGWLCTYYVYDDFGRLRFVLPPKMTELIATTWSVAQIPADELCFRYEYDGRNRMIIKKIPGAGEVWMVYDARNRLVMSQDANLRTAGKWMVTSYDLLNRPVQTGLLTDANNRTIHAVAAYGSSSYPTVTGSNYELLTQTYYDNYSWVASSGSGLGAFDLSQATSGFQAAGTGFPFVQQVSVTPYQTTGMTTGSKVKIISSAPVQYLYNATYYDDHNRPIQTQSTNVSGTGGKDVATMQYSFDGRLLVSKLVQNKAGTNAQAYTIITTNNYDAGGRLLTVQKSVNGSTAITIAQNIYDELGQLKTKKLGSAPRETLDYTYNIRGWLTGINRGLANPLYTTERTAQANRFFGIQLGYDYGYGQSQYNGNIAGTTWFSKGDGQQRAYGFAYDAANRFLKGDFTQNNSGWNTSAGVNFSVKMGDGISSTSAYDANGNIRRMQQWGLRIGSSSQIDDLTYHYLNTENSNKLLNVGDVYNDNQTTLGDFRVSSLNPVQTKTAITVDYTYDANGNLLKDLNKDIATPAGASGIQYNYLNLPTVITVKKDAINNKGTITYTYDAAGNKLWKKTVDNSIAGKTITTTTTYINGFVYESKSTIPIDAANPDYTDVLQFTTHEEGRIRKKTDGTFAYDYFIKDHLGNIRMVLTDEVQTDIYPVATLETSNLATEQKYYNITPGQIGDKSLVTGLPAYVNHNIIPANPLNPTFDNANSSKVYKLNKNSQNMGLGITLRVMSGDKIDIYGKSYYFQNNTGGAPANTAVTTSNILTGFLGGPSGGATNVHGAVTAPQLNVISGTTALINTLLSNQTTANNANTQVPKAFINYILFDDQFKSIASGFAPVGANSVLTDYATVSALHNIPVTKNGFVYIYCSNESPVDVFFDNLQVMHARGPILEETHYYPFGLTMAGISSKAAGGIQNKEKTFQGQRFDDDLGLNWIQFKWRNHDAQIGRFIEIDPLSDKYVCNSTYAFSENKVTAHVELEGLESEYIFAKAKKEIANTFKAAANWVDKNLSFGNITTIETPLSPKKGSTTNISTVKSTTTTHTNFGESMEYIIQNNTNQGNPAPFFKTETNTDASVGTKIDITTPRTSGSASALVDQEGSSTTNASATFKTYTGLDMGLNVSQNSNGEAKAGLTVSTGSNNSTIKAGTTGTLNTTAGSASFEFNLIVEQKIDNTKVTNNSFIRFGN